MECSENSEVQDVNGLGCVEGQKGAPFPNTGIKGNFVGGERIIEGGKERKGLWGHGWEMAGGKGQK